MILETREIKDAVREAAEVIRRHPAIRRRNNTVYAAVVKAAYEEIQQLRDEGYSFDIICEIFVANGVLHAGANPKNFCNAFSREVKRRTRLKTTGKPGKDGGAVKPDTTAGSGKADGASQTSQTMEIRRTPRVAGNGLHESRPASDAEEKERVKNILGLKAVDMGTGKITKNPDGTFDYD